MAKKKAKKPAKKPAKKSKKGDGFLDFFEKSKKTWPGTIMRADESPNKQIPRISTGNLKLDIAMYGG